MQFLSEKSCSLELGCLRIYIIYRKYLIFNSDLHYVNSFLNKFLCIDIIAENNVANPPNIYVFKNLSILVQILLNFQRGKIKIYKLFCKYSN